METIKVEDLEIAVDRKRIRNIYITINSVTGEVKMSAPQRAAPAVLESFLRSKLRWIRKNRVKIAQKPQPVKITYSHGDLIPLFGRNYGLQVFEYNKKPKVFLTFDTIELYIRPGADLKTRRELFDSFYKKQLAEVVPAMIEKWAKEIGIRVEKSFLKKCLLGIQGSFAGIYGNDIEREKVYLSRPLEVGFKKMKSRWGSCNISERKITLNSELAKKSLRCIEYVTAHELLHLKERNHNRRFKNYMEKAFPDWKELETELKTL